MEQTPYPPGPPARRRHSRATFVAWGCVAVLACLCLAGAGGTVLPLIKLPGVAITVLDREGD